MTWRIDDQKLNRVGVMMKDQDVTALVVRAPDNVLYLTNYWCMKGYDAVVFPREGDPTLIVLEPQLADAQRNSWTKDLRLFKGYDERDPRPPQYRALDIALDVLKQRGLTDKVAVELNMGTQSADRMVGEPTTPTQNYFDAFRKISRQVVDATPLLNEARAIKTSQEIERMRLANELAALAMEHTREHMRPGMKESEVGGMYEGFVHGLGVGYKGKVEMARAFTLVWSGEGIRTFTATGDRPIQKNEPTLFEIWVCVDGYWTDLTKNACPGELKPEYH
ncbi:MAG TPA: M24 family metallopeptidase, partial [Terriglobales bacterium]|nr:M24 family metallopeptidase [Terriglobales bacterium]